MTELTYLEQYEYFSLRDMWCQHIRYCNQILSIVLCGCNIQPVILICDDDPRLSGCDAMQCAPECWYLSTTLHGTTSYNITTFIILRTSNLQVSQFIDAELRDIQFMKVFHETSKERSAYYNHWEGKLVWICH